LFGTPSGYQLQQLPSDQVKLVWLIPVSGLLPLIALAIRQGVAAMAGIAGAAPFIALAYYVTQYGRDLLGALQIGAYLTFMFAALLCVFASILSKKAG
jgi:hypothetical protein